MRNFEEPKRKLRYNANFDKFLSEDKFKFSPLLKRCHKMRLINSQGKVKVKEPNLYHFRSFLVKKKHNTFIFFKDEFAIKSKIYT